MMHRNLHPNLLKSILPHQVATTKINELHLKPGDVIETHWQATTQMNLVCKESKPGDNEVWCLSPFGSKLMKKKNFVRSAFFEVFEEAAGVEKSFAFLKQQQLGRELRNNKKMVAFLQQIEEFPFAVHPYQVCKAISDKEQVTWMEYWMVLDFMTTHSSLFVKDYMHSVNSGMFVRKKRVRQLIKDLNCIDEASIEAFRNQLMARKVMMGRSAVDDCLIEGLKNYAFGSHDNRWWNPFERVASQCLIGITREFNPEDAVQVLLEQPALIPSSFNPIHFQSNLNLKESSKIEENCAALKKAIEANEVNDELSHIREDFYANAFTVDSPRASEIDDAISVTVDADGNEMFHVHIADPTAYIEHAGTIDLAAKYKASTIYLPEMTIPMIPFVLAHRIGILPQLIPKALTFSFCVNDRGELDRMSVKPSRLHNVIKMTYSELQSKMNNLCGEWSLLKSAADRMNQRRVREGLVMIDIPQVDIYFKDNMSHVSTESQLHKAASELISEFMIAAGQVASFTARQHKVAIPFRNQNAPASLTLQEQDSLRSRPLNIIETFALLKRMSNAYNSVHPSLHWGMNIFAYSKATSPLRRYGDIIVHRQLKGIMGASGLIKDADLLERQLRLMNDTEQRNSRLQKQSKRFWTLKLIERQHAMNLGEKRESLFEALVIGMIDSSNLELWFESYGLIVSTKTLGLYNVGERVLVELKEINPFKNKMSLEIKSRMVMNFDGFVLNEEQERIVKAAIDFANEQHHKITSVIARPAVIPPTGLLPTTNVVGSSFHNTQSGAIINRIYIGCVAPEITELDLRTMFKQFGAVRSVTLSIDTASQKHKGYAFLEYEVAEGAYLAVEKMNSPSNTSSARAMKVGRPSNFPTELPAGTAPPQKSRIYVANVHELIGEEELQQVFEPFGKIKALALLPDQNGRKHKGYGFIEYLDVKSALIAVNGMDGFELGGVPLRVGRSIVGGPFPAGMKQAFSDNRPMLPTAVINAARNISASITGTVEEKETSVLRLMIDDVSAKDAFEKEIKEECAKMGRIRRSKVVVNEDGNVFVFVDFFSVFDAEKALTALNGIWFGGKKISASKYDSQKFNEGNYVHEKNK